MDELAPKATDGLTPYLDLKGEHYYDVIKALFELLQPQSYLEIGARKGGTLRLASCKAVAVDPQFMVSDDVIGRKPLLSVYQMTSDDFFQRHSPRSILGCPIDLAFLDGMHLFEFLLRDFYNAEKYCRRDSIVVLHDCAPCDRFIATRSAHDPLRAKSKHPGWWAGDVWKVVPILRKYRPDLKLYTADARPTGLVFVTRLDPSSTVLADRYEEIVKEFIGEDLDSYGLDRLTSELELVPARNFMELTTACQYFRLFNVPAAIPREQRAVVIERSPEIESLRDAVVTPRLFRLDQTFSGEVYRSDGTLCQLSLRPSERTFVKHVPLDTRPEPKRRLNGVYLYIGHIFEHFGHDLIELTGRLWPLLNRSYDGVIGQVWKHHSTPLQASVSVTALDVLSAFGVRHSQLNIVVDPISVECIDVPEVGWKIHDHAMPIMRHCFDHLSKTLNHLNLEDGPTEVFISRRRLASSSRTQHEEEIEKIARQLGMSIIHPQEMSLGSQIGIMKQVTVLAGVDGSALHLAAFCKPGASIVSFDTRNVENQYILESLLGLSGVHVDIRDPNIDPIVFQQVLTLQLDRQKARRLESTGKQS
jgi:hypothetical protein